MALHVHSDWALIQQIGPANLARELQIKIQRVQNWKYRGIPWQVRAKHPHLFETRSAKQKARAV